MVKNFDSLAANSSSPIEDEDACTNPTEREAGYDADITRLFEDARDKLERVEANSKRQKKQIVVDLAKSLEGKVPTDTISMEITNQLRGQVSEGFVRQCLEEKYKQKTRVKNALKQQKKQQPQQEPNPIDDLAKVTTLNQDAEKKDVIILDAEGRSMLQAEEEDDGDEEEEIEDNHSPVANVPSTTKNRPFSNPEEQQHEEPEDTYDYDCLDNGAVLKDSEQDKEIEELCQSSGQGEIGDISNHNDKPCVPEGDILNFEFCMLNGTVRKYMTPTYKNSGGDSGKIWFSGKINRNTGKIVHASLGRINEQR